MKSGSSVYRVGKWVTMRLWGNDYNKMEFAGAFGDLGTLIPFVVGYITLNKMDPLGILVAFGIFKIFVGLYFKTPVPIQPMKAIGGMAISHAGTITPGMIWGSGIFTGLFWLLMGLTGAITWIEKVTTKPVVRGIMLGLGLSFIAEGLGMMKESPSDCYRRDHPDLLPSQQSPSSSHAGPSRIRSPCGLCPETRALERALPSFHTVSMA